jgi:hypothetical protein
MKTCSAIEALKVLAICLFLASCGPAGGNEALGHSGRTQLETDLPDARRPSSPAGTDGAAGTKVMTVLDGAAPADAGPSADAAVGVACVADSDCATGFCVDGVCCDTACTESCRSCALSARSGVCSPVIGAPDPGTCEGESSCGATGACGQTLGKACAAGGECASANCVDGVCCEQLTCGTCQACNLPGRAGSCAPLPALTDDENAGCTSSSTCDGIGGCKRKNGSTCSDVAACASGLCVDGVCCDDACEGTCHSCAVEGHLGTCSVVAGQQDAVASMSCGGANICDALGAGTCKLQEGESCATDGDCAFGKCQSYYEDADGDGYGDVATADSRCDASPRPRAGEILVGGDCCDIDARVHPGQTLYRTAKSACQNYDYDCSGTEEFDPDFCAVPASGPAAWECGHVCLPKAGLAQNFPYSQACR